MKNNIAKTSSTLEKIFKIVQGFAFAGVIVAAVMIVFVAILGEKMIASASRLDLGKITLNLTGGKFDHLNLPAAKAHLIGMLASTAIGCAALWYGFKVLRELLNHTKSGEPFASGIARVTRKLAFTTFIGGGLIEAARVIGDFFQLKLYDLDSMFDKTIVSGYSFDFNFSLWFFFTALLLLFFSYMFRRGEELQQLEDETL
ncbi:MAG: hypothetical protein II897_05890 [Clostridia bacterium]|nr:hypothetical protein [Clostridia bacterium]